MSSSTAWANLNRLLGSTVSEYLKIHPFEVFGMNSTVDERVLLLCNKVCDLGIEVPHTRIDELASACSEFMNGVNEGVYYITGGGQLKLKHSRQDIETAIESIKAFPQSPVEQSPIEQAPIEQSPIEQSPVEQAPVEQSPVEQAPVEQSPVEQSPVEQSPIEQAPVEQAPVEQSPIEQAPVEQAPVEQAPVEQAPVELSNVEQSRVDGQAYNSQILTLDGNHVEESSIVAATEATMSDPNVQSCTAQVDVVNEEGTVTADANDVKANDVKANDVKANDVKANDSEDAHVVVCQSAPKYNVFTNIINIINIVKSWISKLWW